LLYLKFPVFLLKKLVSFKAQDNDVCKHKAKKINVEFAYDDFVEIDQEGDHWELFEGELIVSPPPNVKHQILFTKTILLKYFLPLSVFN